MNKTQSIDVTNLSAAIKKREADFLKLIQQRMGIVIHAHQKTDLHNTLLAACKKFNFTPENYLHVLNDCANNTPEYIHLVAGITIGETYFFRDKHQMELLQEKLLPEIIELKRKTGERVLRIWSAGCSTGEDIYTIAMMLCELIPDHKQWTFHLMGTDINALSLQKAMLGYYGQWSMRTITDYFKNKYFITTDNHFQLTENILELVNFSYLNLNENSYPSILNGTQSQDLIVCCNVLIYFDNVSISKLMKKLENCLIPGGYLVLGASDPVILTETNLLRHHSHGHYFSRPKAEQPSSTANNIPPKVIPIHTPKLPAIKMPTSVSTNSSAKLSADLTLITKLMSESHWQKALEAIDAAINQGKKTIFLLNAKANALANSGKLLPAIACCNDGFAMDPSNKENYFIHAMILLELNQLQEAEALLRKAVFLDHRFVEAHYQLGLLLLRCKNPEAGLKCLRNALSIAKTEDPARQVSVFGKLNFGQIVTVLEHELALHTARFMALPKEKKHGK